MPNNLLLSLGILVEDNLESMDLPIFQSPMAPNSPLSALDIPLLVEGQSLKLGSAYLLQYPTAHILPLLQYSSLPSWWPSVLLSSFSASSHSFLLYLQGQIKTLSCCYRSTDSWYYTCRYHDTYVVIQYMSWYLKDAIDRNQIKSNTDFSFIMFPNLALDC
jgi:hypothetical protein